MTPSLPQHLLERVFFEHLTTRAMLSSSNDFREVKRSISKDLLSWSLVCRQWGRAYLAVKWGTQLISHYHLCEVKELCAPIAVPFVVYLDLRTASTSFLTSALHPIAHRLIFLNLVLTDSDREGLKALRLCVNVERVKLRCHEDHRRSVGDIVELVRFLPRLEQLNVASFDAPPFTSRRQADPHEFDYQPYRLNHLSLKDIGGTKTTSYLLKAFNPSHLTSFSSLELVALGNSLTFSLIVSTLSLIAYELDLSADSVDKRLFPNAPSLSLRQLQITISPFFTPLSTLLALKLRSNAFSRNVAVTA